MFSTILNKMASTSQPSTRDEITRPSSADSLESTITVDVSLGAAPSSTPPTSIDDSNSVTSTSLKLENTITIEPEPFGDRGRRARTNPGSYNEKVLSGKSANVSKKPSTTRGKSDEQMRRRTISGDTLAKTVSLGNSSPQSRRKQRDDLGMEALDLSRPRKTFAGSKPERTSPRKHAQADIDDRRKSTRSLGSKLEGLTQKLSVLGKRSRNNFEGRVTKAKGELRRLADTPEFAKIDSKPIIHEVWSKGKLVVGEPPKKRAKVDASPAKKDVVEPEPESEIKKVEGRREKVWLTKGLYAGQEPSQLDWSKNYTEKQKKKMGQPMVFKPNKVLPAPMWHGQRLLETGRDFRLPFDVCSPLPPGQPKPDEWRKTSSNRFIGEAAAAWKKSTLFDSFSSKCICLPGIGCDEDCQNRIMLYECDDTNCAAGRAACTNRSFANLQERRRGGGKYRIGVEVIKTPDRGYGVRSNRCFDANQIIVEYTGEIITEDECDRRMNELYKDSDCYYLMSFDQNMIIDATKGSIARFVNHSCKPNCRMVKWIVGGKPRMALFAGDSPIMTGDELTYDYNFDPFSSKNVQECRCGSENCRGILGPRKDLKPIKPTLKETMKSGVKSGIKNGKRKLQELLADDDDSTKPSRAQKRLKTKQTRGIKAAKKGKPVASDKVVKSKVTAKKITVSAKLRKLQATVNSKGPKTTVVKKTTKKSSVLRTYGKGAGRIGGRATVLTTAKRQTKLSSRNSSLTIVVEDGKSLPATQEENM